MTTKTPLFAAAILLAAGAAVAHQGVTNPTVKARMDAMSTIGKHTKTLGLMVKGAAEFDAKTARQAAEEIAVHAARAPELFEAEVITPKSEALPEIWENYDDFTGIANELKDVAAKAAASIDTPDDLRVALGEIGGACKSCHQTYRK